MHARFDHEAARATDISQARYRQEPEPDLTDPSDKAKLTNFNEDTGRATLRQYEFLVSKGYDGEEVRRWTHYRAANEIKRFGFVGEPPPVVNWDSVSERQWQARLRQKEGIAPAQSMTPKIQ